MKTEKIIVKFLNHEANIHELEVLDDWLRTGKNQKQFNALVRADYFAQFSMDYYDLNAAKKKVKADIKRRKQAKARRLVWSTSVAASIGFILFFAFHFKTQNQPIDLEVTSVKNEPAIIPGADKAILTLGNGNQVILEKGSTYEDSQVSSSGDKITYKKEDNKAQNIQVNQLSVPRGGQFYLVLADGTEVWLNSESKIKYPTKFIKGAKREVELLYGEAFFKVTSSEVNYGSSFNVVNRFQKIQVLGTEFNVKAYSDDDTIRTTLLEGSVEISKDGISKKLSPNQQSEITRESMAINIKDVDAQQEIAWMRGLFSFNDEPLESIMESLSRWYNVDIVFEEAAKKNHTFTGIVERSESIYDLLKLIESTSNNQLKFTTDEETIVIK
ncbi:FecR family protein [Cytophaga sp. FL35]|uniref:FecR family protein n=1 Tax=Cytophaga sp. FL35 TaxID=1904456 RepID=UPI001653E74F|nr:FecR family protein [Cytophaga sp. FL35]MBC6999151.1 FecR family protein [Cytophaga sp. FL35]